MHSAPGPVALVGSGEYLPALQDVEGALLAGRPPRYVQLATAAAPEGAAVLRRWHDLGARAAERLGVEQVVVPVGDRDGAHDPANAALVAGAGLVYLSGGDPTYLTETLRGTPVWTAILATWRDGASLAGCSAGAMALGASVPRIRMPGRQALPGLGVVPGIEVLPHFDAFTRRMPDLVVRRLAGAPPGVRIVGVDEETALVAGLDGWDGEPAGAGAVWQVRGRGSAWLIDRGGRREVASGTGTTLGPPPGTARPA